MRTQLLRWPGKLAVAAAGIRYLTSRYAGIKRLANFFQN